jgi:hypothetical protein
VTKKFPVEAQLGESSNEILICRQVQEFCLHCAEKVWL